MLLDIFSAIEKGKPIEKWGRKATDLRGFSYDSGAAKNAGSSNRPWRLAGHTCLASVRQRTLSTGYVRNAGWNFAWALNSESPSQPDIDRTSIEGTRA